MMIRLPDGRETRLLREGGVNQIQLFWASRKLLPSESTITIRERDQIVQSDGHGEVRWCRCAEYAFYQKFPKTPLGQKITWIEGGSAYELQVPNMPVNVNGKEINLQKAVGLGVFSSIGLLDIKQEDIDRYVVSVTDLDAASGKVRVIDFSRNDVDSVLADETGLPIRGNPADPHDPGARTGRARIAFDNRANGWHGSLSYGALGSIIDASDNWVNALDVLIASR